MSVSTTHPQYAQIQADWQLMQDSLATGQQIKNKATAYLPKTSGMREAEISANSDDAVITSEQARQLYEAYKERAVYPLWVKDGLRTMMGLLAKQELDIVLPKRIEGLLQSATSDGHDLKQLWLRTCVALLTKGRAPLVADYDDNAEPYISEYSAESAINWKQSSVEGRQDLILAVFEEQQQDGDIYSHKTKKVYRVFSLEDGQAISRLLTEDEVEIEFEYIGNQVGESISPLDFLPVLYAGTTDNNPDVDEIPLLSMALAAIKYYQLSADYYTSMHYTSHPQPVITGAGDAELRVTGPMAAWDLPEGASAFYLEFTGAGIEAIRLAMTDQKHAAIEAGAKVMDVGAESGEARKTRQDDQHMTLYGVAKQAAAAIEQVAKYLAKWANVDADEVKIDIEPKFTRKDVDAAMLTMIGNLVLSGELSNKVLYEALRKAGLTEYTDVELDALREGGDLGFADE